jgi:hypothetical protein
MVTAARMRATRSGAASLSRVMLMSAPKADEDACDLGQRHVQRERLVQSTLPRMS